MLVLLVSATDAGGRVINVLVVSLLKVQHELFVQSRSASIESSASLVPMLVGIISEVGCKDERTKRE